MNNYDCWTTEHVCKITYGSEYAKYWNDELMMAIVFGYRKPLIDKMVSISMPSEIPVLMNVVSWDFDIRIEFNGNLTLAN